MKMSLFSIRLKEAGFAVLLVLAFFSAGCGKSDQQKAYEHAVQKEQQLVAGNDAVLVAEYKRVIAMQTGSEWAGKAQAHIDALEAKLKAEELHKSIFQEHGVD